MMGKEKKRKKCPMFHSVETRGRKVCRHKYQLAHRGSASSPLNQSTGSVVCRRVGRGVVQVSVLYIHLLIETMLQNFPSMNYRQPTSTSTVQISAEPANKFLNPKQRGHHQQLRSDIYSCPIRESLYGTERQKKKKSRSGF